MWSFSVVNTCWLSHRQRKFVRSHFKTQDNVSEITNTGKDIRFQFSCGALYLFDVCRDLNQSGNFLHFDIYLAGCKVAELNLKLLSEKKYILASNKSPPFVFACAVVLWHFLGFRNKQLHGTGYFTNSALVWKTRMYWMTNAHRTKAQYKCHMKEIIKRNTFEYIILA